MLLLLSLSLLEEQNSQDARDREEESREEESEWREEGWREEEWPQKVRALQNVAEVCTPNLWTCHISGTSLQEVQGRTSQGRSKVFFPDIQQHKIKGAMCAFV